MQAVQRYILVSICGLLVLIGYICLNKLGSRYYGTRRNYSRSLRSFVDGGDFSFVEDVHLSTKVRRSVPAQAYRQRCRMSACFDFSLCEKDFKVYVYPKWKNVISDTFSHILTAIEQSRFYTSDPKEACLFIPSVDTLDQDKLSHDYVRDIQNQLFGLPYWNNGRNHIIFNLYSGTWPDYSEHVGFDYGEAILAKASLSVSRFRYGFDISFPLYARDHVLKGGDKGYLYSSSNNIPSPREYLLAFKGKRYLTGKGSETRNSLYHVHNAKDIVLLTTCKHGKSWEKNKDSRCDEDMKEYDRYDYKKLLYNSTFCLVPRGRRLGSFRFLEVLQAGCIPVLLSNQWELPFSEIIDWSKCAVIGDERLLLQVPSIVRSISQSQILSYRQQTQFIWERYMSSVEKIVLTTLEIVKGRVERHNRRPNTVWNMEPGGLAVLPEFSDTLANFPFYYHQLSSNPRDKFTALVYATTPITLASAPLFRTLRNVAKSRYVVKMIVLWHCDVPPPPSHKWPSDLGIPVLVKTRNIKTISARFYPFKEIQTDAVWSMEEDSLLTTDEIDFAFSVWQEFPERIVGYPARNHYWDDMTSKWSYTSKWSNQYSIVLTGAAVYHRYYNFLYTHHLPPDLIDTVDQSNNCHDILFNFLVSHVTKRAPIKVTHRKVFQESGLTTMNANSSKPLSWLQQHHFTQREQCMNTFTQHFGSMPLIRSKTRMDPLLFKDPVSNMRKKYRQIETV